MDLNQLVTAIVTNGIGAVCAAAVLWLAYYRETKTIPKMLETFTGAMTAAQVSFEARNTKVVDTFAQMAREERTNYQRWHEETMARLTQIMTELQQTRLQMAAEMRENRHYLRNLANQLGLRAAVEAERKKLISSDPVAEEDDKI